LQGFHEIAPDDNVASKKFDMTMPEKLYKDKELLTKIMFSDTAAFHVFRKENKDNVGIWESEIPRDRLEHI
jgi:hypothetical protein